MKLSSITASLIGLFFVGCASTPKADLGPSAERAPAGSTSFVSILGVERNAENIEREAIVAETVTKYRPQMLYCYERELTANPNLETVMMSYFRVNKKGKLEGFSSQSISKSEASASMTSCIASRFITMTFAPQVGDNVYSVRLEFKRHQ